MIFVKGPVPASFLTVPLNVPVTLVGVRVKIVIVNGSMGVGGELPSDASHTSPVASIYSPSK